MPADNTSLRQNSLPGERLRLAREHYGWSVHDIAEQLHVIPRYVDAIENAEYAQLPGLVFLKGYVRSYARLVGIPEDPLIDALEQDLLLKDHPMLQQVAASTGPFVPEEVNNRKPLWYSMAVLILLLITYLVWSNYEKLLVTSTPESESVEHINSPTGNQVPQALTDESTVSRLSAESRADASGLASGQGTTAADLPLNIEIPGEESANTADNITTQSQAQSVTSQQADTEVPALPVRAPEGAAANVGNPSDIPSEITSPGELPAQIEENTEENFAQAQDAEGLVSVQASFTGDCWFDVRDRDNDRIVGLYRAGDSVKFSGKYPLKFIVGAINAVSIRVNGKLLSFNDYSVKNNRAQFTLGAIAEGAASTADN